METAELLKRVRKIEIKIKGLSRNMFSGEYHSAFKGRGMSFSEVRGYQFGDDVRNIDWNVTARMGEPHVKIFEEERELTVMLLVDASRSALFGAVGQFKSEIITEICALLAFSAISNNDKVGLALFTDQVELYIPPKKGSRHILRIIRELIDFQPAGRHTDLGKALEFFYHVIKKRSICFVIGDFFTLGYEDAETGAVGWLDTSISLVRDSYARRFAESSQYFRKTFLKTGADVVDIKTDESYIQALLQFFQKRSGR